MRQVTIDFEPFKPINTSLYLCDNKFHVEVCVCVCVCVCVFPFSTKLMRFSASVMPSPLSDVFKKPVLASADVVVGYWRRR